MEEQSGALSSFCPCRLRKKNILNLLPSYLLYVSFFANVKVKLREVAAEIGCVEFIS